VTKGSCTGATMSRHLTQIVAVAAGLAGLGVAALVCVAAWHARLEAPAPTILLKDRRGAFLAELSARAGEEVGYWPLVELPPRVVAATVALEDRRFWSHPGIDGLAVARAALQNLRQGRRVSGASTLAMQVARMQNPGGRSYLRKAVEALTGWFLTVRYGRNAILAQYLRLAPYGNRIHGIAYAARRYLDKPIEDLSWAEIVFLAALPQAPTRMNPFESEGQRRAVARAGHLLDLLRRQNVVTLAEYELARDQLTALRIPARETRPASALHEILRFEKELRDRATWPVLDPPILQTTLDLGLQAEVTAMAADAVSEWDDLGAGNAAVMVLDPRTREVLACVASTGFFDGSRRGAIDFTRVPRSPGSTLKPLIYALALELGTITPASVLDDVQRAPGGIVNADDDYLGPLLPRAALANSRNVPAVDLLARVGIEEGYAFLRDLGIGDGRLPARSFGLGLAVGGMPVSLERLVRGYSVLAGDGRLGDLVWYLSPSAGRLRRVLSEDTVRQISLFLSDPLGRLPSFPRMGASEYPFPVAVKTGTSPDQRDAWAMAYSMRYLVGVWVGRADYRPMMGLTGYTSAARLARKVLLSLHAGQEDGLLDLSFPPPANYREVRLCAVTGKIASALCERITTEWFRPGSEPIAVCDAHLRVAIDTRTGDVASPRTPRRFVDERTFTFLPPRYAAWAAGHGVLQPPPSVTRLVWLDQFIRGILAAPHPNEADNASAPPVRAPRLHVASPRTGTRLLHDPETPPELATLALQAVVDPPVPQVVWYVDGMPFRVADYPYEVRWPLTSGEHSFQVRVPFTKIVSSPVRLTVQ
jgi:penicillin-binding protein 1C